GTTIFFTSHDMGDVEQVCRRAMVIDQGRILLDKPVAALRNEYLHTKVIAVRFHTDQVLPAWDGVVARHTEGFAWQLTVDTRRTPIAPVMQGLTATGNIEDITVSDPPMEDVIADIFKRQVSA
ncbi:MAG TPA: ABC transporter, partial [Clostridia bacterium]|nr:ABC transporter [Clostridia bacterium]